MIFREDIIGRCEFRKDLSSPVVYLWGEERFNKCFFCCEGVATLCKYGELVALEFQKAEVVLSLTPAETFYEIIKFLLVEKGITPPEWLEIFLEEVEQWRYAFPVDFRVKTVEPTTVSPKKIFHAEHRPQQRRKTMMRVGKKMRRWKGFIPPKRPRSTNWEGFQLSRGKSKRISWSQAEAEWLDQLMRQRQGL